MDPPAFAGFDLQRTTEVELQNAATPFEKDPYGHHTLVLQEKKKLWDPFIRTLLQSFASLCSPLLTAGNMAVTTCTRGKKEGTKVEVADAGPCTSIHRFTNTQARNSPTTAQPQLSCAAHAKAKGKKAPQLDDATDKTPVAKKTGSTKNTKAPNAMTPALNATTLAPNATNPVTKDSGAPAPVKMGAGSPSFATAAAVSPGDFVTPTIPFTMSLG